MQNSTNNLRPLFIFLSFVSVSEQAKAHQTMIIWVRKWISSSSYWNAIEMGTSAADNLWLNVNFSD